MSDTPRTAAAWLSEWKAHENSGGRSSPAHGMCDFAESLERELAASQVALHNCVAVTERQAIELAEANAVLQNPEKWHKWCDIRVLEQLEAVKAELARKDELIDDLRAMHGVPSDADLARARDDEARAIIDMADTFVCISRDGGVLTVVEVRDIERRIRERAELPSSPVPNGYAEWKLLGIDRRKGERRISERAK